MATTSFTAMRRFAGVAFTLLLFSLCLPGEAMGQGVPLVTASSAAGLSHPTGWGAIQQTAIDSNGDWVVDDYANGAVYEFPAGGGAAITLVPVDGLGGGYENPALAIDPSNNLYMGANWNNGLVMFPWNPAATTPGTSQWNGLSAVTASVATTAICTNSGKGNGSNCFAQYGIGGYSQGYFQPWGIAIGANNTLLIGNQNSNNFIFSLGVNNGWSNPVASNNVLVEQLSTMTKRPISVAQDPQGNVYFVEDSGGLPGLYRVPAGSSELAADTDPSITRVDPNLPSVSGVITDAAGNLYVSDSTDGVFMIPNPSGTPQTSAAVWLSPVPAEGEVAIDWARNAMYVPTSQAQNNGQADAARVGFGYAELGASTVGTANPTPGVVNFIFNGSVKPERAIIQQNGASSPDFSVSSGTCAMDSTYAAGSSCQEMVAVTPHSVGSISAELLLQQTQPDPNQQQFTVTGWSVNTGVLTLTGTNNLKANQPITFSGAAAQSPLAVLNGLTTTVQATGLGSSSFQIDSSAVPPGGCAQGATTCKGSDQIGVKPQLYVTVASIPLHGTGVGSLMQTTPALESSIGGQLVAPSQIAVDSQGNVYVADAGQGKVLMYPVGSGASSTPTSLGTGLTAPTGVAVDGAGDVFIADSGSGAVYEIPAMPTLSQAGGQITLASGLGSKLQLAADNLDDLYVADPTNARVVKLSNLNGTGPAIIALSETMLTSGFTAPSAVGVDSTGNLYVLDGTNLFESAGGIGAPAAVLNSLSGATGVAVDDSGAVYVTSAGGTMRIPSVGGVLAPGSATAVASAVTSSMAAAIDKLGNVYIADAGAGNVHVVTVNGTLTFAPFTSPNQSAALSFAVTNAGNGPLSVTGYMATNPTVDTVPISDWTAADGTCVGSSPVAVGGTCEVELTLNPGPGEQGVLTSQVSLVSSSSNLPVLYASGTAVPLPASTTGVNVSASAEAVNTPVSVKVAPQSGTTIPTGQVGLTYTTWTVKTVTCSTPCPQEIVPVTNTVTAVLDNTGQAQFSLAPVMAGSQTMTVEYIGDRVFGRSVKSVTPTIAKSSIQGLALPKFPDASDVNLPFVVPNNGTGSVPYDSSETPWQYSFNMKVNTVIGTPTGTITMMDDSSVCPPGTSATGVGTATCALASYKGVACPQNSAQGNLIIESSNVSNSAGTSFATSCLYQVPSGTTYTPVVYTHYVTPVYSGDANFLGSTGASTLFQATRGPLLQITTPAASSATAPPPLSVTAGSTASVNLTLTSILGYGIAGKNGLLNNSTFPVTLSCDNLPPHATCTFYYPTPDPNTSTATDIPWPANCTTQEVAEALPDSSGDLCAPSAVAVSTSSGTMTTGTGQVVMTINTDVTVGTTTSRNASATSVTLAALFGFGMIGLFVRRKAFEKSRLLMMVVLMLIAPALAASITACSTTNLLPQSVLKSPSGTYAVTVTAQQVGDQCEPSGPLGSNCTTTSGGPGQLAHGSNNPVSLPFAVNLTVQ
jgi:hypothetical protein